MFRELDPGLYDNSASAKVKYSHSIERAEKPQFPKSTDDTNLTYGTEKLASPAVRRAHNAAEFHDAKAFKSP